MSKIIKLDDNLSNLIAAGEVVVNMASVVKELVENSIDANAKNISIDLLEAGLNEIKVTDDGDGMSKEDMKMSILRHATSKIKTSHDLFHIQSLGFRGEAIPSIASVSHLEIISSEGVTGHRLLYVNGKLKEDEEYAPRKGTVMSVRYLFYNTPARLKHLKATNTELSYIVDYINKMALSHPEISFTLTNDNKKLFSSSGNNDVLRVLSNIYNIDIIKNMVDYNNKNQYFEINGFLTKPIFSRSTRTHITVIANNRMIKNNRIIHAVTEAYKTYLPIGKYPIVLLNINLDPLLIDVNVHPQKLEVKFTEERMLVSLITETLKEKLKELMLIPKMRAPKQSDEFENETLDLRIKEESKTNVESHSFKEEPVKRNVEIMPETSKQVKQEINQKHYEAFSEDVTDEKLVVQEDNYIVKTYKIPQLHYIGQYLGTYLIAQNEEGLYIVDQHAAAERIRYENYKELFGNITVYKTKLLIPFKLDLSNTEILTISDKLSLVKELGLELNINDELGVNVLSVPDWFPKGYELIYTEEIIKYLLEDKTVSVKIIREGLAKNLSCKHSIKANKYINTNEIAKLLNDLAKCENPYTCPHGRPILIKWTQTEIEKMFKRIM